MDRFRKIILPTALIALLLWRISPQASEFRHINTGKDLFCLPVEQSGMFDTPPLFQRLIKGGDVPADNSSFLVTFEPEQVGSRVSEYAIDDSGMPAFLHARITNVGDTEALQAALRSGPFVEGLLLKGDYTHVEKFATHNAWRVSQLPFPDILSWSVYIVEPSANQKIPDSIEDYLLGQCITQTRGSRQCYQVTQVDGYHVRFELNEVNLFMKDKLRAFLANQFQMWRENCKGS